MPQVWTYAVPAAYDLESHERIKQMGRPLNKKYFGLAANEGIGGESVATVAILVTGTNYSGAATAAFSAPQLPGGVTATANITVTTGTITAVALTNGGSGYTSVPTLTVSPATTGTTATFTVTLTSATPNTIAVTAFIPGGASAKTADAVKQASSTRYRVTTADGTGVCSLVAGSPAEGEMNILAVDSDAGEYYVTKLTSRRCTIVQKTGVQFENDVSVGWNISAAEEGTVVKIVTN